MLPATQAHLGTHQHDGCVLTASQQLFNLFLHHFAAAYRAFIEWEHSSASLYANQAIVLGQVGVIGDAYSAAAYRSKDILQVHLPRLL